jgi:hypothetical protein
MHTIKTISKGSLIMLLLRGEVATIRRSIWKAIPFHSFGVENLLFEIINLIDEGIVITKFDIIDLQELLTAKNYCL